MSAYFKNFFSDTVRVVFSLVFLAIFVPLIFGRHIFLEGDSINYFYAYAHFFKIHATAWNSAFLGGFPMPATFQFGFFSPIFSLVYGLFSFITGFHLLIVFYIFST